MVVCHCIVCVHRMPIVFGQQKPLTHENSGRKETGSRGVSRLITKPVLPITLVFSGHLLQKSVYRPIVLNVVSMQEINLLPALKLSTVTSRLLFAGILYLHCRSSTF